MSEETTSQATDLAGPVAIIGAGLMGVGIAQVFVSSGIACALYDPSPQSRASIPSRLKTGCDLLGLDSDALAELISVHDDLASACAGASLIIEAGPENIALKQAIFSDLSNFAEPTAVLASNTSAIPIGTIAQAVAEPSRVVGTHFWNPPYLVPLVEVVQAPATSIGVVERTVELLTRIGMKPVHVKADVPGFVGNRMQHALKREAIALVANGVCSAETVDMVVRHGFGRRLALLGPLEQADLGGTDLTLAIHEVLMPDLDVTPVPHPYLVAMVARGDLGAKSGRGFYSWLPGEADRRRAEVNQGLVDQLTPTSKPEQKTRIARSSDPLE
jgi:3-hydroxybutyryl-CoA dehydrogenase